MTFEAIVDDYIRTYREGARQEMEEFEAEPNSSAAIRRAALCQMIDGKRHPHQRRVPKAVLEQVEAKLQGIHRRLSKATDFDGLHRLVDDEVGSIKGIGSLTVYDISHRIGAHLRKVPKRVYLHAGVRMGAKMLGIRGASFDPSILPKPFARLAPSEIEDCLCIYKDDLAGMLGERRGQSACVVVPKRRRGCE